MQFGFIDCLKCNRKNKYTFAGNLSLMYSLGGLISSCNINSEQISEFLKYSSLSVGLVGLALWVATYGAKYTVRSYVIARKNLREKGIIDKRLEYYLNCDYCGKAGVELALEEFSKASPTEE